MTTIDRWTGQESRALRQAMRLGVRAFATQLGVDSRTVSKWEARGGTARLRLESQALLDTILQRADPTVRERFETLTRRQPEAPHADTGGGQVHRYSSVHGEVLRRTVGKVDSDPSADDVESEEAMDRRALLRNVLEGTGLSLAAPALVLLEGARRSMDETLDGSNVSPATLDRWERTAFEYAQSYQTVPPLQLLRDVVIDFAEVQRILSRTQPARFRLRLCRVGSELAALAGIFLSAMGNQREARGWFHTARLAADEAGDPGLAGLAVVRSAIVALYYGSPASALALARQAQEVMDATPRASRVRAIVVEARVLARLGQASEARRAIGTAEQLFEQLPPNDLANTALGFTERQFWFTVGNAYSNLGYWTDATEAQERALALYQPTEYLDPALIRLDQATCLAARGEADAACELAATTIAAAPESHRHGLITHCGREFYNTLPVPVRQRPAARELNALLVVE